MRVDARRYLLRRLVGTTPLLFGITFLTFALANFVPGSPVTGLELNPRTRPEDVQRIREALGLNEPLHPRYFYWVANVMQGDLGVSTKNYRPVTGLMLEKVPNTLLLTGTSLVISLAIAIPVGISSAVKRNSTFDNGADAVSVAGYSTTDLWLGLMLMLIFAVGLHERGWPAFPAGGAYDPRGGGGLLDRVEHLILPVFALSFGSSAGWTRSICSEMLEVLSQDYIRTARAKGLTDRVTIYRHGPRNALIPVVTLLGLAVPGLFGGALLIENIFTYPGLGQLAYQAAIGKGYPVIMGTTLVGGLLVILGNLVADLLYVVLDPRINHS